jgi:hypothetical protein
MSNMTATNDTDLVFIFLVSCAVPQGKRRYARNCSTIAAGASRLRRTIGAMIEQLNAQAREDVENRRVGTRGFPAHSQAGLLTTTGRTTWF